MRQLSGGPKWKGEEVYSSSSILSQKIGEIIVIDPTIHTELSFFKVIIGEVCSVEQLNNPTDTRGGITDLHKIVGREWKHHNASIFYRANVNDVITSHLLHPPRKDGVRPNIQ